MKRFAVILGVAAFGLMSNHAEAQVEIVGPVIEVVENVIDLGTIPRETSEIVGEIVYFNTGEKPLEVSKVTGSCSCFAGYSGDKLLQPGEGGILQVRFDKSKIPAGKVTRNLTVLSNDPANEKVTVTFKFNILRDAIEEELRKVSSQVVVLQKEIRAIRKDLSKVLKLLEDGAAKNTQKKVDTTVYNIEVSKSPSLGPEDARVTIVEFVDLQCPYCVREFPKIKHVLNKYPKDVKVVFKHFPLGFHKKAKPTHAAVQLAFDEGGNDAFWKMHDMILAKPKDLETTTLRGYAEKLKLDLKKFDSLIANNQAIDQLIKSDMALAKKCGVRGTPTVFVNGLKMQDRTIRGYQKRIDQILAQKKR